MTGPDAFKILLSALGRWETAMRETATSSHSYYQKGALDAIEAVRKSVHDLSDATQTGSIDYIKELSKEIDEWESWARSLALDIEADPNLKPDLLRHRISALAFRGWRYAEEREDI